MFLKVNYFAADKGKSLICRIFIKAEMILFCVYAELHMTQLRVFSNDFLHSSSIKSFTNESSGTRQKSDVFQ